MLSVGSSAAIAIANAAVDLDSVGRDGQLPRLCGDGQLQPGWQRCDERQVTRLAVVAVLTTVKGGAAGDTDSSGVGNGRQQRV